VGSWCSTLPVKALLANPSVICERYQTISYSSPNAGMNRMTVTKVTLFLEDGTIESKDTKCFQCPVERKKKN